jgi:hypothetical protein
MTKPNLSALRSLESMRRTLEAKKEAPTPATPETPQSGKVIQLPLWPEPVRGAPNDILRSALFAAIQPTFRTPLVEVAYFTVCLAN